MEISVGLMSLALTTLGLIFAYIWKSNGKLQKSMMETVERIENAQEQGFKMLSKQLELIENSQKSIAQMLLNQTEILKEIKAG